MGIINGEELAIPLVKKHPFQIQSLNMVLDKDLPPLKKLIGDLIYSEEQTILFGGMNVGKSILAMNMARAICTGDDLNLGNGVVFENECEPMNVIYYDFELSERQIRHRLNSKVDYGNLYWANITRGEIIETEPDKVFQQLKSGAEEVTAKCIIIDNISKISGDLEKGENAKAFMGQLWNLARHEGYSIIVLSHTVKGKPFEPINENHLKGSGVLKDLCDSLIALAPANAESNNQAYIKQLKGRNDAKQYGSSNVIHTETSVVNHILCHQAIGFANEMELLTNISQESLGNAQNRMLFVYAILYYGGLNKASKILRKFGIKGGSKGNLSHHLNAFINSDSKKYKELEMLDLDALKELMESQNPNNECLPFREDHPNKSTSEIPF